MNQKMTFLKILSAFFVVTSHWASPTWAEEPETTNSPSPELAEPTQSKEFLVGDLKILVNLTNKQIDLISNSKSTSLKGPYFGRKDRWVEATSVTFGTTTYLEFKVATFPDGTSELRSDLWWVVFEFRKNRLVQKLSRPIASLTEDDFYSSMDFLLRVKTEIREKANHKVSFILNEKEIKP